MTIRPDNRLADAPMRPVRCRRCGAEVLARKSTMDQTSIQWNADASSLCAERGELTELAAHGHNGIFLGCAALSEAINRAVYSGELAVVDEVVGTPA